MCVCVCVCVCVHLLPPPAYSLSCLCSKGCLLLWTVTWGLIFLKKFQHSQCQEPSKAYSRCSVNTCWTELAWTEFSQCTREGTGATGEAWRQCARAFLGHGSECAFGSIYMLWTRPGASECKPQGGNTHSSVCMCGRTHTCASSKSPHRHAESPVTPGFSWARFLPGKPGAAKISMKMVVFG